ncbi:MAG: FixH family protein [Alphaproteobacteria bacterium]|nr:FixH family protein [Alphaproteobacteria bacterium]
MILLLLSLACATSDTAPQDEPAGALTQRGLYRVELAFTPEPPPLSRLFEVQATVRDARGGAPVTDAVVAIDAQMPDHGHGMSTQPVNEPPPGCAEAPCTHPDGVYRTTGMKFHMPGRWTVSVDVQGPAGSDRAVIPYEMAP